LLSFGAGEACVPKFEHDTKSATVDKPVIRTGVWHAARAQRHEGEQDSICSRPHRAPTSSIGPRLGRCTTGATAPTIKFERRLWLRGRSQSAPASRRSPASNSHLMIALRARVANSSGPRFETGPSGCQASEALREEATKVTRIKIVQFPLAADGMMDLPEGAVVVALDFEDDGSLGLRRWPATAWVQVPVHSQRATRVQSKASEVTAPRASHLSDQSARTTTAGTFLMSDLLRLDVKMDVVEALTWRQSGRRGSGDPRRRS
jgi:hypothetical protein